MGNRLARCCCEVCEIFTFTDVLTEAGTSVIDGYTVVDQALPVNLWQVNVDPRFAGRLDLGTVTIEFRLLRPNDTVYAEWSFAIYRENNGGPFPEQVTSWDMAWGSTFTWGNGYRAYFTGSASTVLSDFSIGQSSVFARNEHAMLSGYGPAAESSATTGLTFVDTVADTFYPNYSAFDLTLADPDLSTSPAFTNAGLPLPLSSTELATNGPFRFGVKVSIGANTLTIPCYATRIYQEPLSTCVYGYYGGVASQAEANAGCPFPRSCAITHPHYTTPIWEISTPTSDVTLDSSECEHKIQKDGFSQVWNGTITTADNYSVEYGNNGTKQRFSSEWSKTFCRTGTGLGLFTETEMCYRLTGARGSTNPADYLQGSGPTFRSSDFPCGVSVRLDATADPCEVLLTAYFYIYAWVSRFTGQTFQGLASATRVIEVLEGGSYYYFGQNPQYHSAGSGAGFENFKWSGGFTDGSALVFNATNYTTYSLDRIVAVYEKTIPAWNHSPPTVSFTSADLVSGAKTWNIVTAIDSAISFVGAGSTIRITNTYTRTPITAGSIEFSLVPHSNPIVPHP